MYMVYKMGETFIGCSTDSKQVPTVRLLSAL